MKNIKNILIFILITVTIYWNLLYFLLTTVNSDYRLQQIELIEKQRQESQIKNVLYIHNLTQISDRFKYFTFHHIRYKKQNSLKCPVRKEPKAVLIISSIDRDPLSLFPKFLSQFERQGQQCYKLDVYVLKRRNTLLMTNDQYIHKYTLQVGEAIKYLTIEAEYEVSLLSYEEGAVLTFNYFAKKAINILFTNIVERVKSIVLVDLYHPFLRLEFDPPYSYLEKVKKEIVNSKQRVDIFNRLKFIFLSTHKQNINNHHKYDITYGKQDWLFIKSIVFNSREIGNLHYNLPIYSINFFPFLRRIAQLMYLDIENEMNIEQISYFLKYGESWQSQVIEQKQVSNCSQLNLNKTQPIIKIQQLCFQINPYSLEHDQIVIISAPGQIQVYSNQRKRIYPYDNLTEISIFLLQKIEDALYVINYDSNSVTVSLQTIATPSHPIQLTMAQIANMSQILYTNYTAIRVCPDIILLFPLHFPQSHLRRNFLFNATGDQCYEDWGYIQQFSYHFFLNWSVLRNVIIFTILCSEFRGHKLYDRIVEQFCVNYVLLYTNKQIQYKFIHCFYIIAFALILQYLFDFFVNFCKYFTLRNRRVSVALLSLLLICFICFLLDFASYWRIYLMAMVFFISDKNVNIFFIKLYFISNEILSNINDFTGFASLGLLTMWLYTSLQTDLQPRFKITHPERFFCGILVLGIGLGINNAGTYIQSMITMYMKVILIIKMLQIVKK